MQGDTHVSVIDCNPNHGTVTNGPTVDGNSVCITYCTKLQR